MEVLVLFLLLSRQLSRGKLVRAHNEEVRRSGVGEMKEERPTDFDEALARRVLEQNPQDRRDHFAAGLARTAAWVRRNADRVEWIRPDAGAICCVRLRPDVFDDESVSRFYAELAKREVRVAGGAWFGDEARVFRLGFGLLPLPDLETALTGVSAALDKETRS